MSQVQITHWRYKNVTKDYDIYLLQNVNTGHCLVARRWGKMDAAGQCKVTTHVVLQQAKNYITKVIDTRKKNGYEADAEEVQFDNMFGSREAIGFAIGSNVKITDDEFDTIFTEGESDSPDAVIPADKLDMGLESYGDDSSWGSW